MVNTFTLQEYLSSNASKSTIEFPLEAFPLSIQRIIKATKEYLLYPVDFMGVAILYAIGLAMGNTFKVQVMREWIESASLYVAVVGRPGTSKSHPLTFVLKPIFKRDQATLKEYEQQKREYDQQMALAKKDREGTGKVDLIKPAWQKQIIQDYTPEALLEIHKNNPRGLGVYSDELMGFFKNFGRYSNGGSDQEFWLSAWSGKHIIQDRKSGEPIMIPQPFIPVIGTIQEGLLQSLAKDNRNQNGFIDRVLFAFPEDLKKEYWNQTEICPTVAKDWEKYLLNLLEITLHLNEDQSPAPNILSFTPEAYQLLMEWQRYNTDLINAAPMESLAGVYTKLETYCIRLSLILQMAAYATCEGERQSVEIAAVWGAIQLTEYFRHTGTRVHDILNHCSNPLRNLSEDKRLLFENLPDEFSSKEGEEMAGKYNLCRRTFYDFIADRSLFKQLTRGRYQKHF